MTARDWRAPRWMPLFVRRWFPGVWTRAEVDAINARAERAFADVQRFVD